MNTPEDELHQVSAKAVYAFFVEAFKMDALPISVGTNKLRNHPCCPVLGLNTNSSFVLLSSIADLSIIEASAKINFLFIWS